MFVVTLIAILGIINAHPFDELHQYVDDHVEDYVQVSFFTKYNCCYLY